MHSNYLGCLLASYVRRAGRCRKLLNRAQLLTGKLRWTRASRPVVSSPCVNSRKHSQQTLPFRPCFSISACSEYVGIKSGKAETSAARGKATQQPPGSATRCCCSAALGRRPTRSIKLTTMYSSWTCTDPNVLGGILSLQVHLQLDGALSLQNACFASSEQSN